MSVLFKSKYLLCSVSSENLSEEKGIVELPFFWDQDDVFAVINREYGLTKTFHEISGNNAMIARGKTGDGRRVLEVIKRDSHETWFRLYKR